MSVHVFVGLGLIPDTTTSVQQQNRSILEPILEEDSDEEEQAAWSLQSYETNASTTTSTSSSGDSCDSVVQLAEVNFLPGGLLRNPLDDTDERDFLCPAKRRKHDFFDSLANLKVNLHKIRFDSLEPDYHKKRYAPTPITVSH